jgi:hypothetical protein
VVKWELEEPVSDLWALSIVTAVCIMVEASSISKIKVHLFSKSSATKIDFYLNNEASY